MDTQIDRSAGQRPARPDLLHELAIEHRDLDAAFAATIGSADIGDAFDQLLDAVAVHELAELELLDRVLRFRLGDPELADRRAEEQRLLLRLVRQLRDSRDLHDLRLLHVSFVEHSDREEIEAFPALRHVMTAHEIETGWQDLQALRVELARREAPPVTPDRRSPAPPRGRASASGTTPSGAG